MKTFDDVLVALGIGKWNLIVFIAVGYWSINPPCQSIGGALVVPMVPHTCLPPPHANVSGVSQCWYNVTDPSGDTTTHPCTHWAFDNTTYTNTITSEFSLVCDRQYLRPTYKSLYFFGSFFGAPLNGILADRYGRRRMVVFGTLCFSLLSNLTCWLPSMQALLALRFILGIVHVTSIHATFTLAMEMCEPRRRTLVGVVLFLPWTLSVMALGGWAWLIRDWRWLVFATSLPTLLFLPVLLVIDESPRWLIVRGRHEEALAVLQKAARWNGAKLPSTQSLYTVMHNMQAEQLAQSRRQSLTARPGPLAQVATVVQEVAVLFSSPRIRTITLSLYVCYLVLGTVYYGLSLGGDRFGVDPFLYMTLSGVMEIPGSTLTVPMMEYIGRRNSNVICFFMTAAALLILGATPQDIGWLVTTMALVGKMMISAAYQIITLHVTELLPTEVRVRGLSVGSMIAKVGSIAAPFLVDVLGSLGSWVPLVVFGCGGVVAGLVTLRLPETKGRPLYDTVAALENDRPQRLAPLPEPEDGVEEKEALK